MFEDIEVINNLSSSVINNTFLNDGLAFESLFTSNPDIYNKFEEYTLDYYLSMKIEGNFWNDWLSGNYVIDGSAGAQDIYPLSSSPI